MDTRSISSRFRDLIQFLSSVQGDLSNVTAPPTFLAPSSVVEVGHCWAQRPAVFAAPAHEESAEKRALLVLRLVLIALRSQLYIAGSPTVSIKKPLNAFLGELFLASWKDAASGAKTRLVAEQVSHHPPITAMHIADEEAGVRADGYARVEMTFNGTVNIRQVGHAVLRVERFEEDYLIPLPDVKVRGFLGGRLYPEVLGSYNILASSGFVADMDFSGEGYLSGRKNSFEARIYHKSDAAKKPLYTVCGVWSEGWTVKDARSGEVLEKYEVDADKNQPADIEIAPRDKQDPWESRRAWGGVLDGMETGDFCQINAEKKKVEQAQRQMRKREAENGESWEPLLFKSIDGEEHDVFHELAEGSNWRLFHEKTKGVWRVKDEDIKNLQHPLRGDLTPLG